MRTGAVSNFCAPQKNSEGRKYKEMCKKYIEGRENYFIFGA